MRETRGGEEASTCLHTIYAVEYRRSAECSRSNSSSEMRYKNEGKVGRKERRYCQIQASRIAVYN